MNIKDMKHAYGTLWYEDIIILFDSIIVVEINEIFAYIQVRFVY